MNNLTYESLTIKEKNFLTDDCGNHFLNVPDWVFTDACRRHDFAYWLGCTEKDREAADWRFYLDMLESTLTQPWYRRIHLIIMARMYYYAVRLFSGSFFYYSAHQRTQEDLDEQIRSGIKT